MKLQTDHLNQFHVVSGGDRLDLTEVVRAAIQQDGRAITRIQEDAGLSHPRLAAINYASQGNKTGLATLLIALMEMGYEIRIEKTADSGKMRNV
jgi:hypothetical protein